MHTHTQMARTSVTALVSIAIAVAAIAVAATTRGVSAQPRPAMAESFMSQNARAMDKMMKDMTVAPSGNVDRDFVAMMVPHHQGAIDMAVAELRYGKDETLRRMAQEIIVEQQQEIAAMRLSADRIPIPLDGISPLAQDICTSRTAGPARLSSPAPQGNL